jgi:serine/threonine-protein kinase
LEGLPELVPDSDADPLIGVLVADRYRVVELIGRGGMGAVYKAEHVQLHKFVALKALHREMTVQEEVVARFEREAIAAGRIEHPNVVQARDFGRLPDGSFYLVLEYVEGKMLGTALKDAEELFGLERILNITGQIAEALAAAHSQGVIHRDLKPDNVMLVVREGEPEIVKVMDFGIAKISLYERADATRPITQAGSVFGTPEYMSPEQAAGQPVDERGDLYSLGLLLYRMLAGNPPFTAEEVQAVLMMQITQPPPELDPDIPDGLRSLVYDLLKKQPDERPQRASEVVARVLGLLGSDMTSALSKTRSKLASVTSGELPRTSFPARADSSSLSARLSGVGQRIGLWKVAAVAILALCAGVSVAVWAMPKRVVPNVARVDNPEPASEVTSAAVAPPDLSSAPAAVDPEFERLLGKVFEGDKDAVSELEQKPPEKRSVREWLALARAYVKNRRPKDALDAYAVALVRQPNVAEDAVLRRDIISTARESETADRALHLAADYLGADGADLLYKIWVDTRQVTPSTSLARELVYSPAVRRKASPALKFVLSWREAIGCDEYKKLLPEATLHADRRALTLFNRAKLKNECKLPEDSIDAAIMAARDRQQPAPY